MLVVIIVNITKNEKSEYILREIKVLIFFHIFDFMFINDSRLHA